MNTTETLKAKLSKEALRAMLTFGRIARSTSCSESYRCFSCCHRVAMNLIRSGAAEHLDHGSVRLTDIGLELAVAMKHEPYERYSVRRRWHRKPTYAA